MSRKFYGGEYSHFKGKNYFAYGIAENIDGKKFVLYQQQYGNRDFWIRPLNMFFEKIIKDGKEIPRFYLKHKDKRAFEKIISVIKEKQGIIIKHSETLEEYHVFSIDTKDLRIIVSPYESNGMFLSDSQLALRLGFELLKIDGKQFIFKTKYDIPISKQLNITYGNNTGVGNEQAITQLNPCSLDLHIAEDFFSKAKRKIIDIATNISYSIRATELWQEIPLRKVNGFDGIVIKPKQTIFTHTYERIEIPDDCAGKIEIKSTYARLALSVTESDFCNPGWKGYFPLTIRNNGRHSIVLHPKEKMLQLSLISTDGYIVNNYSSKSTYMNDTGTPFKFWHAKTVEHLQNEIHAYKLLEFYENVLNNIDKDSSDNVDREKERFKITFLSFCERRIQKEKHQKYDEKNQIKLLWDKYKKKEDLLKFVFSKISKVFAPFATISPSIVFSIVDYLKKQTLSKNAIVFFIISIILAIVIEILLFILSPKCFCTFEKLEFDRLYPKKRK